MPAPLAQSAKSQTFLVIAGVIVVGGVAYFLYKHFARHEGL